MTAQWTAILGVLVAVIVQVAWAAAKFGALEVKVDTIWEFFMRRAMVEAQVKGFLSHQSEWAATDTARRAFAPILTELKQLRADHPTLSRNDFMLLIERRFGQWIVENVCVPHRITDGACLVAAYELCRRESRHP